MYHRGHRLGIKLTIHTVFICAFHVKPLHRERGLLAASGSGGHSLQELILLDMNGKFRNLGAAQSHKAGCLSWSAWIPKKEWMG